MQADVRVRDLFDLPEQIRKGDFVLKLTEGIGRPRATVDTYVVTPALAMAFDQALSIIGGALRDGRSQAAFLHGSFGSGKSHFMALLSLLLDGREEAWRVPELHPLRERHAWVGTERGRLLQLHFHMIGADSMESAIFRAYLEHVRRHHAGAPVPALFADEQLFDDAARMLDELGDAAFFAPMREAGPGDEWGDVNQGWDRRRFEAAARSTEPAERAELFDALVKTRFKAYALESRRYIDLDAGLGVIARHAASLGYRGVVLFLDELILWLASRAADAAWLHGEAQKMVKLVEAQDAARDVPIVSFIARQRDLAKLVGEEQAGAENARLRDSMQWSEDRFSKVPLEDRNLPAIVERRVLRPRDADARAMLDRAFEDLRRGAAGSWQTLLGQEDAGAFRKVYPFSPALVEALVALSGALQRERTAIKLLMELLVEHIPDLRLGEVVRVGDLFDVLASGEDTADGPMRARFDVARELYRYRFLPLIQDMNGTTTAERCQRLRPAHPTRIGCSGCAERACRTDNRILKTLIIAALVPEVPALRDMTASKLVQLNHGTIRLPVPGDEASHVAQKLRDWASKIGQLHIDAQRDPTVRLQLEGVDLDPILEQARHADSEGGRQRVVRDLLFEALGLEKAQDWGKDHKVEWRGTTRVGHVRFGNVRKMTPEQIRCPEIHDWRLVVDYPFDEPGFGPNHDLELVERVREDGGGTWTVVWLPSFFSDEINRHLGDLVVLEHILESKSSTQRYVAHLSVENQSRAERDLENLRSAKRARILQVLEQAYGLRNEREGDLDGSRSLEQHVYLLKAGAVLQPLMAANLGNALETYVPALLEARYPRHPRLGHKLTRRRVDTLLARFGEIIDADDKRIGADRGLVDEMSGTLGELGLVRVTETAVHLVEDRTLQGIENRRRQAAVDAPTVAEVQRWIDDTGKMGLQPDAMDLVVRCYARWASRTFTAYGQHYEPQAGKPVPDDVVLARPDLPGAVEWSQALGAAGALFGVSLPGGKALHADNVERLGRALGEALERVTRAATRLPALLRQRLAELGLEAGVDRLRTAASADALCAALAGKSAVDRVRALAGYQAETSPKAVGASLAAAGATASVLEDALVFGVFAQLRARQAELAGAAGLMEQAAAALRQDEVIVALAPRLRGLAEQGQRLLAPVTPLPGPLPPGPLPRRGAVLLARQVDARGRDVVRAELARLGREIEDALSGNAPGGDAEDIELVGELTLRRREP
jgi:hypothetical protein